QVPRAVLGSAGRIAQSAPGDLLLRAEVITAQCDARQGAGTACQVDVTGAFGGGASADDLGESLASRGTDGQGRSSGANVRTQIISGGSARKHGLGPDLLRQTRFEEGELR